MVEAESLPEITEPVEIDGTTAPGYAGTPVVLLDGRGLEGSEAERDEGLVVSGDGGGTLIDGLAIGRFEYGVWLDSAKGAQLCGSYVGVEPDGTTPLPNRIGVEAGEQFGEDESVGNEIGAGCDALGGNLISGNEAFGVADYGMDTAITSNRIGVDATGGALPNGGSAGGEECEECDAEQEQVTEPVGAGILVASSAEHAVISSNVIADNKGAGVEVESVASEAKIRANSIFQNTEGGIVITSDEPLPAPTIGEAFQVGEDTMTIAGEVTSEEEGGEEVSLDFFASESCGEGGEGQTYLGSAEINAGEGLTPYEVTVAAAPPSGEEYITATATGSATGATSEFSNCSRYVPLEAEPKHEETKQTQSSPSSTPPPPASEEPTPSNGEKVVVKPEEGKVLIKLPGTKKYVKLEELKEIPVGAVIDATNGRVTLTSIGPDGTEQMAEFFGGVFKVKQKEGSNLVVLELLDLEACPAPKSSRKGRAFASASSAHSGSKSSGKLWGSGHGNFRTEGNQGSATVRGTIWLVEDRCNGTTFFKTRRGIVSVKDFILHKTLPLPAGKTYVAGEE